MPITKMKKRCDICGDYFYPYKGRNDGLPTGTSFVLENGDLLTVCTECILSDRYADVIKIMKEGDKND